MSTLELSFAKDSLSAMYCAAREQFSEHFGRARPQTAEISAGLKAQPLETGSHSSPVCSRPQPAGSGRAFLSEIHALGVDLFLHRQGLDTTTPGDKAMFGMMGVFAEFERAMIQERVRAGLARARAEGKRLGRPSLPKEKEAATRAALSQPGRPGVRKIAQQFGVNPSTVQRVSAGL
jgi:hypothetical protein